MITRREPLLWLQLMAVAVIPLELELLRLLLAGPALGPAPALERLLIWGLAVIGPGLLLWRRPADWGSMLLVRLPLAGRSSDQRRISALPQTLAMKAALVLGMALLLFGFWSIDRSALLVTQMSPLANGSRLTALLLAGPLLTLMLWQWQQLCQAIWLLTRSDQAFENLEPVSEAELRDRTMSFGLNVLQLPALEWPAPKASATAPTPTAADREEPTAEAGEAATPDLPDTAEEPEAINPETSASVGNGEDKPALNASDDSSTSSEATAEQDSAKPDQSELEEPETEDTDRDDSEPDPAVMPELLDSAEDADAEADEPALNSLDDSSTSSEATTEQDNAKPDQSEPEEPETEGTDADDAEQDPVVMQELLDSAEDADAEADEPALISSDDSSTSSKAATEPDQSEPDEPEADQAEAEEPQEEQTEADAPEADPEATSEPAETPDDADSLESAVSGSIEPEQGAEDDNGPHLDGKVTDDDLIPGGEAERHHEET